MPVNLPLPRSLDHRRRDPPVRYSTIIPKLLRIAVCYNGVFVSPLKPSVGNRAFTDEKRLLQPFTPMSKPASRHLVTRAHTHGWDLEFLRCPWAYVTVDIRRDESCLMFAEQIWECQHTCRQRDGMPQVSTADIDLSERRTQANTRIPKRGNPGAR
ncbi:hypothetical protein BR93DRAFT_453883 [Coniochaeta sp. PMI_546]|nr:hypothetical protein BR93DRAFT_453883 [Coniochaeta sp. PMI_546]